MWKVLFGFSSLLCLIVIVFILIKMAREVILLSTATLPKGGGWGVVLRTWWHKLIHWLF